MSGICGIMQFDGKEADERTLARMGAAMHHRGEHGITHECAGPIGLGHCRLRVYREDAFDAQPVWDDSGRVMLVFSGRLDNRDTLADAVGCAASLNDMADSALAMACYRQWGADFAERLIGDFAIAIWDGRARQLHLIRDHMGQQSLVFHRAPDFIAFASETKALWAVEGVPREIDDDGAAQHLLLARPPNSRHTLLKGIEGLHGGERLTLSGDGGMQFHRYWRPHAAPEHVGRDEAYYVAAYRRVLGEAVACRIRRLVDPPALGLSGGFDSTAIAGLCGPVLAARKQRLITVASVMPADRPGVERDARPMVELCRRDMPHIDLHYVTREGLDPLTAIERGFAEVDVPPSPFHYTYAEMARIARAAGARLMMDGHGGDTTLNPRGGTIPPGWLRDGRYGTYWRYMRGMAGVPWRRRIRLMITHAHAALPAAVLRLERWMRRGFRPAWHELPVRPEIVAAARHNGRISLRWSRATSGVPGDRKGLDHGLERMASNAGTTALNLIAAVNGQEITRPFMDKRVVELALAIPDTLQVANGRGRQLALKALADIYPPEFATRSSISDLRVPEWGETLARHEDTLHAWLDDALDDAGAEPRITRWIDVERTRRMINRRKRTAREDMMLSNVLIFARYARWISGRN